MWTGKRLKAAGVKKGTSTDTARLQAHQGQDGALGDVGRPDRTQLSTFALQIPLQVGWAKELVGDGRVGVGWLRVSGEGVCVCALLTHMNDLSIFFIQTPGSILGTDFLGQELNFRTGERLSSESEVCSGDRSSSSEVEHFAEHAQGSVCAPLHGKNKPWPGRNPALWSLASSLTWKRGQLAKRDL